MAYALTVMEHHCGANERLSGQDHEPSSGITRLRPGTQPAVPLFSSTSTSGVPCLGPPPQRASPKRSPGEDLVRVRPGSCMSPLDGAVQCLQGRAGLA